MNKNLRLPTSAKPDNLELVLHHGDYRYSDYFASVERRLGGALWRTSLDTWDRASHPDQVKEADMIVFGVIVPADSEQRKRALIDARAYLVDSQSSRGSAKGTEGQVWSLANYRDPEVRAVLEAIGAVKPASEASARVPECGRIASLILDYWA
ncbi:hypothetical protein Pla123a_14440 [Posidoniimonas polymericola]|uniref:Uncharacterized protein n=1 Tax=Posidoniimonas polymericola TaxID=2528002 RepID=A0A5C5YS00_9BACT|nr:hypothetical protein [Posidoniimonas polymericola]TWT77648.1 hypothetical protein Pla123a_14440 [Posidoniimonas polymericola]